MRFKRVKGTRDILPGEALARRELEQMVYDKFSRAGFLPILTPTFEAYELYQRSTGQASDIVIKEMYRFADMGGRDLALRPEATPSVMRAVLENYLKIPIRLWYAMTMFRQDKPQKGRYREHTQIGAEIVGEAEPEADIELVKLGYDLFTEMGIKGMYLELNTIGCRECRPGYTEKLVEFLKEHQEGLCSDCKVRMKRNPLRVFDCKVKSCQAVLKNAPSQRVYLCQDCRNHFDQVKKGLEQFSIPFNENDRLVRGLDYYSRTVVEFKSTLLGAQDTLCGGGRYDYLAEELGGPSTPATGFAFGVERALLVSKGEEVFDFTKSPISLLLLPLGDEARGYSLQLLFKLREAGISVQVEFRPGRLSRKLKHADARNAERVLIVGEDEIAKARFILRDMKTGEQRQVTIEELLGIPELKEPPSLLTSGEDQIT
ncbi:histidine--tRNA ligase [candidate division WOR-3 bacterium]|nr:histidine--tRNA ligase [candidate division WOR-3 bacterium]